MELTIRFSNRKRYAKSVAYMFAHPEKYAVSVRGRDYSAALKDPKRGCGFYITYTKLAQENRPGS